MFYAHGFGGHGQRQWELAEFLSSQGFPYFVLDHQGAVGSLGLGAEPVGRLSRVGGHCAQALGEARGIVGMWKASATTSTITSSS